MRMTIIVGVEEDDDAAPSILVVDAVVPVPGLHALGSCPGEGCER